MRFCWKPCSPSATGVCLKSSRPRVEIPNDDLRDYLGRMADFLTPSDPGAVCCALIGQAQHDPAFAAAFRSRFLRAQRDRDRLPLDRAIARGQLPPGTDVAADVDQLVGPVCYRVLVTGEPVGRPFTDRLVDGYLRGLPR